jgi:hypothetical protein
MNWAPQIGQYILTELTLDPPSASGGEAGVPLLD